MGTGGRVCATKKTIIPNDIAIVEMRGMTMVLLARSLCFAVFTGVAGQTRACVRLTGNIFLTCAAILTRLTRTC